MPIPGFIEQILSAAFLTVLAAVVIGAFWVGWGLLSPVGEKKDAPPGVVSSSTAREEKRDAFAEIAPVPTAKEKKDAVTEMALVPAAAREEEKDAPAVDLCAATAVEGEKRVHELVEEVGVASVAVKERAHPDMVPSMAEREEAENGLAGIAPASATTEKKDALTGMLPPPAVSVEEKDPLAADLCSPPPVEGEKTVHEFLEDVGAAVVAGEERAPADMAPSTVERKEDALAGLDPVPTAKEKEGFLMEISPPSMPREDGNDALAVDLCATPAVEKEKKVHDVVEEVDAALLAGEERGVPLEETALTVGDMTKADGPMIPETAEKVVIRDLTLEELKAYDGSDAERPLLMAIKGHIYDVSRSRTLYGPGCHYELFGGRDVTRALALMSFETEDLTGKIDDLKKADLEVLGDWEQKFMEKYPIVGRLVADKSRDGKQQP